MHVVLSPSCQLYADENSEIRIRFPEKGNWPAHNFQGDPTLMPNQKQRKKKHGENKSKKAQAMRTKEAVAKPADKPSATGKRPGQTSKFETIQDRPGNLRRA